MERAIATLVLTRPLPAARRIARALRAAGWPGAILFSPILEIVPLAGVALSAGTLVFTSENGVRAAAGLGVLAGRDAVAVGERTARVARRLGATCLSADGDADDLVALLLRRGGGPYIHIRGCYAAGDLAPRLRAAGLAADEALVYDQRPVPIGAAARAALAAPGPVVLPLFSARSARLVAEDLRTAPVATTVVALSARVAAAWPWEGDIRVAERQDAATMVETVAGLVGRDGGR